MTNKISFWNFISENTIEVPIIQRDYAQGRQGNETLRKNFLCNLKKALDNEKAEIKLDFVYGSTENYKFNPLDGQQRLTTLWLLHWYIALRAGLLNEKNSDVLKKFTYETRISSREFCHNLCIPKHFEKFTGTDIVGFITKQTWFYSAWKQDPTIQSMLRMLSGTTIQNKKDDEIIDGIEETFKNTTQEEFLSYWIILTSKENIAFYHLPLEDFGLSDDLYIKMNARGKQLTSFENFKADLIGYITEKAEDETLDGLQQEKWKSLLDPNDGLPIKLDTDWTNIFWNNKSLGVCDKYGEKVKSNQIDEIYFAFLNRLFWNYLFISKNKEGNYILSIGERLVNGKTTYTIENENASYKYLNKDNYASYDNFEPYKYYDGNIIPIDFFKSIMIIFDNLKNYHDTYKCKWDKDFKFIPEYSKDENGNNVWLENKKNEQILKVTTLNQVQRIVFFALCKYLHEGESNTRSLERWLRVIWNLVSGEGSDGRPQIRSTQAVRTAIEFINKLNSHSVYESLINYTDNLSDTDFDNRCKEEIAKAKQIIDENGNIRKYNGSCKNEDGLNYETWERIIIEAESTAFFKGTIRFLFQNEKGKTDIDISTGIWNTENFDTKFENARKYFGKSGLKQEYKSDITKALVVQCDNWWEQLYNKQIFNPNSSTWKWILTANNWQKPIHKILMANTLDDIDIAINDRDSNIEKNITPILNKLPYKEMIEKIPDGRFRWHHGRLGFYIRQSEAIIFDWERWKRNEILGELYDKQEIFSRQKIANHNFFWGWNINFEYKGYKFQWYRNYDNQEYDIYMMDQDWNYQKMESKDMDQYKYYCFNVNDKTPTEFKQELDNLIDAYTKDSEQQIE